MYWVGNPPEKCDWCSNPITTVFFDARTKAGPWACLCPQCQHGEIGTGKVGPGVGQKYEKKGDKFIKTMG